MVSLNIQYSSVQFSHSVVSNSLQLHGLQHAKLPCTTPTPGACSNSCPSSWWCHPTFCRPLLLLSSVSPSQHQGLFQWVSSWHQVAKVLELQPQHQSMLPMNTQGWFPFRLTGLISLQSKGLSKVFFNTSSKASILWHSAFFMVQLSYPYITTGKAIALTRQTFVSKVMSQH